MKMIIALLVFAACLSATAAERRISVEEYRDRMEGAWLGQSVGVAFGWPTEFKHVESIIPEKELPVWKPEMVNNTYEQDDLYVEMTFLRTLETRGIDVSCREAGIDFANSRYRLWCANFNGRDIVRKGIASPSSSHPKNHPTPDDIDYQIEADYAGIISPGMPQRAVKLGEQFGRIMNYGDGLYAGQFMGGMYAAAYFEKDRVKTVEAGLKCIPAESKYAKMVNDMLAWYRADPKNWQLAWTNAVEKYGRRKSPMIGKVSWHGIDVKINGAMVLLGYLWGEGDVMKTTVISTRGGYDSDCNPSSALGVLGVQLGMKGFGEEFKKGLDRTKKWEFTDYDWAGLMKVSEKLTREFVVAEGGRIEKDASGKEWFVIPEKPVVVAAAVDSLRPGPGGDEKLTEAENARILLAPCKDMGNWSYPKLLDGRRFTPQLVELYREIVDQIKNGVPYPNKYVYRTAWRRDAAMVAMVLEKTGDIGLIRDWILSFDDPFDRNNGGNEEPDNIGESLYLIGCVTNHTYPVVKKFVEIAKAKMDKDGILTGTVDGSAKRRVYAMKWLKLGLKKCGLDDSWVKIPEEQDDYDSIFWMDGSRDAACRNAPSNSDYPYLSWASWHKGGRIFTPEEVPVKKWQMTWEANASQANYEVYRKSHPEWADRKISYIHSWHAAEMFLLLFDMSDLKQ